MFLVLDREESVLSTYDTSSFLEAAGLARDEFRQSNLIFDGDVDIAIEAEQGPASARAPNPARVSLPILTPEGMREASKTSTGISRIKRSEVVAMSEGEAFALLRPLLPNGMNFDNWASAAGSLLSENYKMEKAKDGTTCFDNVRRREYTVPPSLAMGVSFLPHKLLKKAQLDMSIAKRMGHPGLNAVTRMVGKKQVTVPAWKPSLLPEGFTVCVGATPECRASCLVYTGQNDSSVERDEGGKAYPIATAMIRKARLTQAFLAQPTAFVKLLHASIERHIKSCKRAGIDAYVRMNVLSDLLWEDIYPEIFDYDPKDVVFYDYTKIPFRRPNKPYDLTFSYAGTEEHNTWLPRMLNEGRRMAMVLFFVPDDNIRPFSKPTGPHGEGRHKIPWGNREEWRNLSFGGIPVYDGDCHDLRPRDPSEARLIGLQYKEPTRQKQLRLRPGKDVLFLVQVERVDMDPLPGLKAVYAIPPTPRTLHGFDFQDRDEIVESAGN